MTALHVTDKNFEQEVLKSNVPVMVDFWAEWCGPCRMIAPIVDEVSKEYAGKLKVAKLNVDQAQQTAMKYSVMSIPTLIFFKDGKPVDQVVGAMSKDNLVTQIKRNLS